MLTACMIDGFGWFEEADYRRGWLAFDEVEYLLLAETRGPIFYPDRVWKNPQYQAVKYEQTPELVQAVLATAKHDLQDPQIQKLLSEVPASDAKYAMQVVQSDKQLIGEPQLQRDLSPPLALTFLANKLVAYSLLHDRVPIVGRSYASKYLALKLASLQRQRQSALPLLPRRFPAFIALASGCSLPFVADQVLVEIDFVRLDEFKQRHAPLRKQHQLYLLDATRSLKEAADGAELEDRIAAIRMEAEKKRVDLIRETTEAWLAAGLDIAKKAAVGSIGGLTAGFALMHRGTLSDLLVASLPGLLSGVGVGTSAALDAIAKARKARQHSLAYLMEFEKLGATRSEDT